MKALPLVLAVMALCLAQTAVAQSTTINIFCAECRDLGPHPEDARNFAVNQFFGANSWLSLDLADRFRITDSSGNTVTADINASIILRFKGFPGIELPISLPVLPFAEKLIIQVRIVYANGNIVTYRFDASDLDPNGSLPVPVSPHVAPAPADSSPNDGSNGASDYYDGADYWDGWENGYGGQLPTGVCAGYFPEGSPNAGVVCSGFGR